jgi:transcriptional regulator with XRE-family HTH domain
MTISVRTTDNRLETDNFFADLILSARKAAGYTLEQVAITTGLTADEINAIENGSEIESSKVKRLASALRIPHDRLV